VARIADITTELVTLSLLITTMFFNYFDH